MLAESKKSMSAEYEQVDIAPAEILQPQVTAVIVNYNGMAVLADTLRGLDACGFKFSAVIVADDGSTDGSDQWVRDHRPDVTIFREGKNTGRLGYVRNLGLKAVRTPYAFLTDNDISVCPGAIEEMLRVLRSDERNFCVTPRLLHDGDPNKIYTDGNHLHFVALATGSPRNASIKQHPPRDPFQSMGGGVMLLDMKKTAAIGFFDEGYVHGWGDDGELHIRGAAMGYRTLHVSRAACLHKGKTHGVERAYGQIYNRYRMLLTVYQIRSLLLLSPSLLLLEIGLTITAIQKGFLKDRIRAVTDTWRRRGELREQRRRVQRSRKLPDLQIMQGGAFELPGAVRRSGAMGVVFGMARVLFNLNWVLIQLFL